jgi:Tfp pilus assembly protein PilN
MRTLDYIQRLERVRGEKTKRMRSSRIMMGICAVSLAVGIAGVGYGIIKNPVVNQITPDSVLSKKIKELEAENKSHTAELAHEKNLKSQYETENKELKTSYKSLEGTVAQQSKQIAEFENQAAGLATQIDSLKKENSQAANRELEYKKQLAEKDSKIGEQEKNIQILDEKIKNLEKISSGAAVDALAKVMAERDKERKDKEAVTYMLRDAEQKIASMTRPRKSPQGLPLDEELRVIFPNNVGVEVDRQELVGIVDAYANDPTFSKLIMKWNKDAELYDIFEFDRSSDNKPHIVRYRKCSIQSAIQLYDAIKNHVPIGLQRSENGKLEGGFALWE